MKCLWNAALNMFTGIQTNLDGVVLDRYGSEKLHFPAAGEISVSPDGKWIGIKGNLYQVDGTLAAHISDPGSKFFWAPDSGSFFQTAASGSLFIYRLSDGWKGELADGQSGIDPLGIVQPPVK
jgi:hypothetical protein